MNFKEFKKIYEKKEVEEIKGFNFSKPLVSVCVQTYQHENYIRQCLESLLNQETNFLYEILIGEDHSNDETRNICLEYSRKHPEKIRLFLHHRENQIKIMNEPTGNFNAFYNFFSSNGKYIAFCEGDDIWSDPEKLQKQVDFLEEHSNFIFTYHSYISINSLGERIAAPDEEFQPKRDLSSEDLLKLNYHPLLLTTCFRNVITDIPLQMTEVINVDSFLFSLLGKFGKAKYLPNVAPAKYRKHTGGIWSEQKTQKKFESKIITFQKLANFYKEKNKPQLVRVFHKKLNGSIKTLLFSLLKTGDFLHALKLSAKLFRINL